jgi:hypothetical protein
MCRDSLLQDGRNKFFFSDIEERSHARHFSVLFYLFSSVADPGCLSRIRFFPSWIQGQKDSRIRIRIKEFKYFKPKNCFYAPGNMIRDVHPGSGS